MLDGTKSYSVSVNPQKLLDNPYLADRWTTTVRNADGTVKHAIAEYLGFKFQLKHQKVRLQGSLHKYHNAGLHNYNDFTAMNVEQVINELSEKFEIDTAKTELNNLEFGVNVVLPFGVSLVLNNLIAYKGEPFIKVVEEGMNYYQCKKTHFIIKIYDKGKQYKLPENVLRFEIKVIKMQYLKTKGVPILYLSDLLNKSIYEPLGNILTEVFENILFGDDTLNEKDLSDKERELYLRGNNPKTWNQTGGGQRLSRRLNRLETSYKDLLERHRTGVNFRLVVAELIRKKSLELSTFYQEIENVLRLENVQFLPSDTQDEKTPNVHFLHFSYSVNNVHTPTTSATTKDRPRVKLCSGCGKPIEPDRLYHSLECKIRRDERNARSNDRNNFKNRIKKLKSKPSLFDVMDLIKLTPQQKKWLGE